MEYVRADEQIFFSMGRSGVCGGLAKAELEKLQRYLLEGVRKEPFASKEILDMGCGVGALHMTLLLKVRLLLPELISRKGDIPTGEEIGGRKLLGR